MGKNNFVFACARVRANERNLLSKEKLNQMIDARTMEDAVKILQDANYGEEGAVIQPLAYEKALVKESDKLYAFLHELAPDAEEFRVFAYPFDYHNIKVLLKAEATGAEARGMLMSGGVFKPAEMEALVRERNLMAMTPHMKKAIEEAVDTLARTRDPQTVDLICDRECYADILEVAQRSNNRYLLGYVHLLIDTINLKTFVRCRRMGQGWGFFETVYLEGGSISSRTFVAGYDEPLPQFAQRLAATALAKAAEEGGTAIKETGRFTSIEKLCDDALISYVKDAKYISFGIEPLIGYAVGKQMEIKSVRIILAGKAAGIDGSLIRERVRETYG
ncbi:MAG: V-type ATP synthase subunit C [Lachnospiraceae bacterium]|nr:V-type ATP synthase subunit C [Lachnospiraceae bacterium]